ncbi:MAG: hypothetical protein U9P49_06520 [Thermodesulfobacteriota bacterium]|nr:hypothetical protein [Thermodesulfobacteriota bacterium]
MISGKGRVKRDLWSNEVPPKEVTVSVYHDEREVANNWLYHSLLFIPVGNEKDVLNSLNEARQKTGWWKELHFVELDNTETENHLALEWIDLFAQSLFEKVYFYFFSVNYQNLDKTWWSKPQRDLRIYNRFFQIGLYGAIKWFFLTAGFKKVSVQNIFSDKKSRRREDKFHTQPMEEIEVKSLFKGEDIVFEHSEIIEIDSDHERERDYPSKSHFAQFVDLIMGTFSQIFDNTSKSKGKCMAADKCLTFELPAKLMKYNTNSRYYKRYAASFFPKQRLTKEQILEDDIRSKVNQFYNKREMKYILRNQRSLF